MLLAETDNKFNSYVRKIFKCVQQLDKNKHLEPKFSESIEPLYRFLKKNYTFGSETHSSLTRIIENGARSFTHYDNKFQLTVNDMYDQTRNHKDDQML